MEDGHGNAVDAMRSPRCSRSVRDELGREFTVKHCLGQPPFFCTTPLGMWAQQAPVGVPGSPDHSQHPQSLSLTGPVSLDRSLPFGPEFSHFLNEIIKFDNF